MASTYHHALAVIAQHLHYVFARDAKVPLDAANLHSGDQHPRQSKRDFFWKFLPMHSHFEAVSEIDVDDFA